MQSTHDQISGIEAGNGRAITQSQIGRQILNHSQGIVGERLGQCRLELAAAAPTLVDQAIISPEAAEEAAAAEGHGSLGGMSTLISALRHATEGRMSQRRTAQHESSFN